MTKGDRERLFMDRYSDHGFVFPSHFEGFGLPVLESMSKACPVICTKNASLPEVGGEAVQYWEANPPRRWLIRC